MEIKKSGVGNIFSMQNIACLLIFISGIVDADIVVYLQIIFLMLFYKQLKINKSLIIIVILLSIHALINIVAGNDTFILCGKQLLGISVSFLFFYSALNIKNFKNVLSIYINYAVVLAAFSILQQIAWKLDVSFIYDLRWLISKQVAPSSSPYRSSAFFTEPSACALILMPAVYIGIYYFIGRYKYKIKELINLSKAVCIMLGFIFTFSSAGYIGMILSLVLIWLEYKHSFKQILVLVFIIVVGMLLYTKVALFSSRINGMVTSIFADSSELASTNISSQTLIINGKIAIKNFINTLGSGGGIGSHQIAYEKYINSFYLGNVKYYFNKEDANSLLLRIISELGILGLIGVGSFLVKFRCKNVHFISYLISRMCIVYFLLRLLRYGHYFNNGLWLFIVMYYLAYKYERIQIKSISESTT